MKDVKRLNKVNYAITAMLVAVILACLYLVFVLILDGRHKRHMIKIAEKEKAAVTEMLRQSIYLNSFYGDEAGKADAEGDLRRQVSEMQKYKVELKNESLNFVISSPYDAEITDLISEAGRYGDSLVALIPQVKAAAGEKKSRVMMKANNHANIVVRKLFATENLIFRRRDETDGFLAAVLIIMSGAVILSLFLIFRLIFRPIRKEFTASLTRLAEANDSLVEAQAISLIGSWALDPATNTPVWSDEVYRIMGLTKGKDAPVFDGAIAQLSEEDQAVVAEHFTLCITEQKPFHDDMDFIDFQGQRKCLRVIGRPIVEDGVVVKIKGTVQDITQYKEKERQASEAQSIIKALLDNTPNSIFLLDNEMNIMGFNKVAQYSTKMITGKDVQRGMSPLFLLPQDVHESFVTHFRLALKGVPVAGINNSRMTMAGNVWVEYSYQPARDDKNNIIGVVFTMTDITKNKQNEIKVRESEARLKEAQELAQVAFYEIDLENEKIIWSDNARWVINIAGFDEFSDKKFRAAIHPDDFAAYIEEWENAGREKRRFSYNFRIINKDGNIAYISENADPTFDSNGNLVKWLGSMQNITGLKESELKVLESERTLRAIITAIPDIILRLRPDCTIFDVLSSQDRLTFPRDTLNGNNIGNLPLTEDIKRKWAVAVETAIKERTSVSIEYRFPKEFGERFEEARIIGIAEDEALGIIRNITEKKQSETRLLQQIRFNERIASALPSMLIIYDFETQTYGYISRAVLDILGYTKEEYTSMNLQESRDLIHPDDIEYIDMNNERIMRLQDEELLEMEYRRKHKNGKYVWINSRIIVFERARGKVKQILILSSDISQRKRFEDDLIVARDEAERANRAKSFFLANMSHEIRTPMNAILGFGELLQERLKNPVESEYISGIITSGRSLLGLINDILDLSKVESGKMELSPEPLNLRRMMEEVRQFFVIKAKEKGIGFAIHMEGDIPVSLLIDELRLKQVIVNIVNNAVKFTHEGSVRVTLSCKVSGSLDSKYDMTIEIEDTGIGIPESQFATIFEPFRQQDEQSTKKYGGTGLGLTITKKMVELMGGTLEVESEVGKGSRFTLVIPDIAIAVREEAAPDDFVFSGKSFEFQPAKILVVEDMIINQKIVAGFLEPFPFTVGFADSGKEALEKVGVFMPDLVLMDINMADIMGDEVAAIIKRDKRFSALPIIALTANAMRSDRQYFEGRFDAFLTKPIAKRVLITELAKFLPCIINQEAEETRVSVSEDMADFHDMPASHVLSLASLFLQRCEEAKSTLDISSIEALNEDMRKYAAQHRIESLSDFCSQLKEALTAFNIPEVIKRLEKLISHLKSGS